MSTSNIYDSSEWIVTISRLDATAIFLALSNPPSPLSPLFHQGSGPNTAEKDLKKKRKYIQFGLKKKEKRNEVQRHNLKTTRKQVPGDVVPLGS